MQQDVYKKVFVNVKIFGYSDVYPSQPPDSLARSSLTAATPTHVEWHRYKGAEAPTEQNARDAHQFSALCLCS